MNNFPCTGCGACCRRISQAVLYHNIKDVNNPLYFPYSWDSFGVCEMLGEDNKCTVYDKRPLICNIKSYAEYMGHDLNQFMSFNIHYCNKLMDLDNLPLEYRIK